MKDNRCQVGIPLDSWILPVSETAPPQQPMLFINSPRWLGENNKARGEEIIRQLPNDVYQLTIADTAHTEYVSNIHDEDTAFAYSLARLTPRYGRSKESLY